MEILSILEDRQQVSHQNQQRVMHRAQEQTQSQLTPSEYSFQQVIPQEEFAKLAEEIDLTITQRSNLVDKLYANNKWSSREDNFTRHPSCEPSRSSPYEAAYLQWKKEQNNECGFKETYGSSLALVSKGKRREDQLNSLLNIHHISGSVYQFTEREESVSQIKLAHAQQLEKIMAKKSTPIRNEWSSKTENKRQMEKKKTETTSTDFVTRSKMVELAVQKELLTKIKQLNQEEKQTEEIMQKEKQFQKTCFLDRVKNPPPATWTTVQVPKHPYRSLIVDYHPSVSDDKKMIACNNLKIRQKVDGGYQSHQPKYKLNIPQILKIPYKQFLIFYTDNYHHIVALSSPQQLQQINRHRSEALQRQEALQKLKKKVASYGPDQIAKIPPSSREKLFRILYEQDLQLQRSLDILQNNQQVYVVAVKAESLLWSPLFCIFKVKFVVFPPNFFIFKNFSSLFQFIIYFNIFYYFVVIL